MSYLNQFRHSGALNARTAEELAAMLDSMGHNLEREFQGIQSTFQEISQSITIAAGGSSGGGGGGSTTPHNLLSVTHPDTLTASPVLGDLLYADAVPEWTKLAGNITSAKQFLTQTGTGAISAVPVWDAIIDADLPATIVRTSRTITIDGTLNRITSSAGAQDLSANRTWTLDIAATYVGQTSITTLGTIATGVWQGTLVGVQYGGTGANLSATGGASQYVKQAGVGAAFTVGTIPAGDIGSGAALTAANDTNVTLSLGGTPATALLVAASITAGWTGTLAEARLSTTGVTLGSYGSATQVGTFTVTATGRLTAAANVTVTPAAGSITGAATLSAGSSLQFTAGTGVGAVLVAGTLNTIQDIRTTATPQWTRLGLGAAAQATWVLWMEAVATPSLAVNNSGAAANNKLWYQYADNTTYHFGAENDAQSVVTDYLAIVRSGTTITSITLTNGTTIASAAARTSGSGPYLRVVTPADTGQTAGAESIGIAFGGTNANPPVSVTRTFAAAAITTQREYLFVAPTYSSAGAMTITNAATVTIDSNPGQGGSLTITNSYALLVQGGNAKFGADVTISGDLAVVGGATFDFNNGITFQNLTHALVRVDGSGVIQGIAHVATGSILVSQGTTSAPAWSTNLPTSVSITGLGTHRTLYIDGSSVIQGVAHVADGSVYSSKGTTSAPAYRTLLGTSNQITVTTNPTNFTFSTPQDIHTAAAPQFARMGINVAADANIPLYINSAATPSYSQLVVRANALGGFSILSYAADNIQNGFDVDWSAAGWVARATAIAWIRKSGSNFIISGSTGNTVGNAGTQTDLWTIAIGSGILTQYMKLTTTNNGFGVLVASSNLTTQGAAISATTIYAVPAAGVGLYRVSWVATVTRAATTSCTLGGTTGFQLVWTDQNDSVVKTSNPAAVTFMTSSTNATGTTVSGVLCAYCKASTNLQYAFGYTSSGGTSMQYDISIRVEFIG